MKKKGNKKKQNKVKTIAIIAGTISLLFFIALLQGDPFTYGDYYLGTTISAYQPQTEHGSKTRIVVQLDNGKKIEVRQTNLMGPIIKGKRAIVQECITMILKRQAYRFIKYIDENSGLTEQEQLFAVINKNNA